MAKVPVKSYMVKVPVKLYRSKDLLKYSTGGILILLLTAGFIIKNQTARNSTTSTTPITLGAYYFDGWSTPSSGHLTPRLRDSFPDRKPKWGWITSTPEIIKEQIDLAADAGLSFFSFCWYYPDYDHQHFQNDPLNHAVNLYLTAPNKKRLKFCLLIANHGGQIIGPNDWGAVTAEWLRFFKDPNYLLVEKKPLISFFSVSTLLTAFGSPEAVHRALDSLRGLARLNGLNGVSIAACVSPTPEAVLQAKNCGFDLVTGYNYPTLGFKDNKIEHSVDSLVKFGQIIWNRFKNSPLPYIPVATLNWDPRPWATATNFYSKSVRYTGYSANSVYQSVKALQDWISQNPNATTKEHIALLYAWNEYGEGAWLTPTENDMLHLLAGIKKALSE